MKELIWPTPSKYVGSLGRSLRDRGLIALPEFPEDVPFKIIKPLGQGLAYQWKENDGGSLLKPQ